MSITTSDETSKLDVRFRCICPSDLDEVENLHIECLPVRYGAVFIYDKLYFLYFGFIELFVLLVVADFLQSTSVTIGGNQLYACGRPGAKRKMSRKRKPATQMFGEQN